MRVLLTNDDGIDAVGLRTLHRALCELPELSVAVVAPASNQSGMARSITTRRPLWVEEVDLGDGRVGYAADGTPVDCVRLASLGLIDGWQPDVVLSGINHGTNLGDDVTYSGTVAAALEAIMLGIPGIAVSQQSRALDDDLDGAAPFQFEAAASFAAALLGELDGLPLPPRSLLNVNFPGTEPQGVTVTRLGRRFYHDALELVEQSGPRRRSYHVYGQRAEAVGDFTGTDIAAVAARHVSVTPLQFDLTYHAGLAVLAENDLGRLLPRSGVRYGRDGISPTA